MGEKNNRLRTGIQVFFFLLVGVIAVNHTLAETGASLPFIGAASVHAICPFGGVETLYQLFTTGQYIQKIHASALVLMGIVFGLAILFGPVFCGWICPLGSVQEWVGKLGKRLLGRRYNQLIPRRLDKVLRYLRYILLGLVLYNTAVSGMLLFANIDPYYALYHFWTGETGIAALVILAVTLLLSLVVERSWCKYACPYGAMLGLFNFVRIFKVRRTKTSCIDCGSCDNACPMNIEVSKGEAVLNHQCISCLRCTSETVCPVPETVQLSMKLPKQDKAVLYKPLAVAVLVLMFGGIAATSVLGYWSTTTDKTPETYKTGEAAGAYDPSDIRGSYTIAEVSELFQIEPEILREAFQIPMDADLNKYQSKNLEALFEGSTEEIGNSSLQVFVALYKNLPIALGSEFLPDTAVKLILRDNDQLTDEQRSYLESHTLSTSDKESATPPAPSGTNAADPSGASTAKSGTTPPADGEPLINGQVTFKGLLDLGITQAQIESVIQGEMPATNLSVRDYCRENGLSFGEIKDAFNVLVSQ